MINNTQYLTPDGELVHVTKRYSTCGISSQDLVLCSMDIYSYVILVDIQSIPDYFFQKHENFKYIDVCLNSKTKVLQATKIYYRGSDDWTPIGTEVIKPIR